METNYASDNEEGEEEGEEEDEQEEQEDQEDAEVRQAEQAQDKAHTDGEQVAQSCIDICSGAKGRSSE